MSAQREREKSSLAKKNDWSASDVFFYHRDRLRTSSRRLKSVLVLVVRRPKAKREQTENQLERNEFERRQTGVNKKNAKNAFVLSQVRKVHQGGLSCM